MIAESGLLRSEQLALVRTIARLLAKEPDMVSRVSCLADGAGSISDEMHVASLMSLALGFATITARDRAMG